MTSKLLCFNIIMIVVWSIVIILTFRKRRKEKIKDKQNEIQPCWHWVYNTLCDYCRHK